MSAARAHSREAAGEGEQDGEERGCEPSAMPFQVTLLLADAAQAIDNKLYILGGGWSVTGPGPMPSAIALHVKVPWDQANLKHRMRLELVDADGHPVEVPGEGGPEPLRIENEFEVGRPAGLAPGTPIDVSLAINLSPLPLEPGSRYEWRLEIDDQTQEGWHAAFSTRPARP